jgi:hypothetical protein
MHLVSNFKTTFYKGSAMNESDRRKMERFDLKLPAKLTWTGKDKKQESIELMTSNVCSGGAYLMTNRPLPVGTHVKSAITLNLDRIHELKHRLSIINVSGDVIRTDHQGMAIRFDRKYKILPH